MSYYNTTGVPSEKAKAFVASNNTQNTKVLKSIINLGTPFSPKDVFENYNGEILMTSVRRAINTNVKLGYIVKTGKKVKGLHGRNEIEYKLS